MDDVVQAIESSFRALLRDMRYRSVTVKEICERAHVSRKTFYANFRDKEDIVKHIFEHDVIQQIRKINDVFTRTERMGMTLTIQSKIYQAIYNDRVFWRDLVVSMKGRDDTFIRVVTDALYDYNLTTLTEIDKGGDAVKADYAAYFFASSQAMLMQKWICDDFPLAPEELSSLYSSMGLSYWKAFELVDD